LAGRQHRLQGLGRRFAPGQEVENPRPEVPDRARNRNLGLIDRVTCREPGPEM